MAQLKKLQSDIDKALKKVDEGVEEYNRLREAHARASQPNQKEKLEESLKAQIKKLQRDRNQLSQWIADKNVKEKDKLEEGHSLDLFGMWQELRVHNIQKYSKVHSKEDVDVESLDTLKESLENYMNLELNPRITEAYHTKYLTWFQRHEEPRYTAPDYECGAYVYFDFEAQWMQSVLPQDLSFHKLCRERKLIVLYGAMV
eukprot:Skav234668  [mRNA]  locus=scaffold1131:361475:371381:- [translate_table: standard]